MPFQFGRVKKLKGKELWHTASVHMSSLWSVTPRVNKRRDRHHWLLGGALFLNLLETRKTERKKVKDSAVQFKEEKADRKAARVRRVEDLLNVSVV